MGSGGVAIAALPTVICLKVPFSDGLGGEKKLLAPKGSQKCDFCKFAKRYHIINYAYTLNYP